MTRYLRRATYSFTVCLILIFFLTQRSFAQSIYNGGSGDGFSIGCFVQPNNPLLDIYGGGAGDGFAIGCAIQPNNTLYDIYNGGNEDGFAMGCAIQANNTLYDIYNGGNEDGFAMNCFIQPNNTLYDIYNGGVEDGFAMNCFIQPNNVLYDIYNGGVQDGFSMNCFVQPNNVLYDIYGGGSGDGFSIFCLGSIGGEVPLPIRLLNFNGNYQNNVVLLQWKTVTEINNDQFIVERSGNGVEFTALAKIPGAGTSVQSRNYSFTDEDPVQGINYYRLKQVDVDGLFEYSPIISVYAFNAEGPTLIIFPNPSDNSSTVHIRMKGVGEGTPVELTFTSVYGQVITSFNAEIDSNHEIRLPESLTSGLTSGIYVVSARFTVGQVTAKWVVR